MGKRFRVIVLLGAAGLVLSLAAPAASAQVFPGDSLEWERVGDVPVNADDIAFDASGALWAIGSRIYRLPAGSEVWEEMGGQTGSHIFPLSPDTLLYEVSVTFRSLDGGHTWEPVWNDGGAFYETALGGPHRGLLLTGASQSEPDSISLGYSTDRGATWHRADFTLPGPWIRTVNDFLELPEGHAHAGRLLAVGVGGFSYSDDGGRLWHPSNLWADLQAGGTALVRAGDGTPYALGGDGPGPGPFGLWTSEDGAEWTFVGPPPEPESLDLFVLDEPAPKGTLLGLRASWVVEGSTAGTLYRSPDWGLTWEVLGQVPLPSDPPRLVMDGVLGPDGQFYVGIIVPGCCERGFVYRTVAPVLVAAEPGPVVPRPAASFVLHPAHPNPSRGVAVVPFELSAPAAVRIAVYDVLGREVAVLLDGRVEAGRHEAVLGGSGLPSGTYLVRATFEDAGGQRSALVRRITLLK